MDWNSSILWGIIGLVGGAIVSSFFYFIGIKRKRLSYEIDTICLISNTINQIKGLKVKYKSNKIDNLYSSKIVIKNIGNSTIEKQDFASTCPISISTNGQFLLNKDNDIHFYPIHKANNIRPTFNIDKTNNTCNNIVINFDYLAKGDKFSCSLFHTGDISFDGVLKDGEILSAIEAEKRKKIIMRIFDVVIPFIVSIISILFTTYLQARGD